MTPSREDPQTDLIDSLVAFIVTVSTIAVLVSMACTPEQRQAARSVLSAADFACVLMTPFTAVDEVARACRVAESAVPALREALAGKAGAVRAGACHDVPSL